jgi:predicted RNA binding protein YcfA (HicA-like mRNA interferase family)
MTGKLPAPTGEAVVRALERAGFRVSRVVPVHAGETIGPGLLGKILRDCGLDREAFRELLD